MTAPPRRPRILVIKLGALGDAVIATAHIQALLDSRPGAEVHLLTSPACDFLFRGESRLRIASFPRKGARAMWATFRWLRRQRFDQVFDFQCSDRSRVMTLLSGAPLRAGLGPAWPYSLRPAEDDPGWPIFDRLNNLLQAAGMGPAPPRPRLWTQPRDEAMARDLMAGLGLAPGGFVVMHAGSNPTWQSKRWEEEHFATLARKLAGLGLVTLWVGGQGEADLNARLAAASGIDLTARLSLPGLAALARHARFAVTNDSAPMHILSTAGIPVYALFGPTNWRISHAVGQAERVLRHPVPCSPCHLTACPPERDHACLRALLPEQVLERLQADGLLDQVQDASSDS